LSSLFDYLCERNAVAGNPVDSVKRPMANGNEGSTPALGDAQARKLLDAPPKDTLKGIRDRGNPGHAALSRHPPRGTLRAASEEYAKPPGCRAFPHQGQAREDQVRAGSSATPRLIEEYLAWTGESGKAGSPLFRPVKNNRTGTLDRHLDPASIYRNVVTKYGRATGIDAEVNGLCVHSLRATAAINALSHESDIAKVQEWSATRTSRPHGSMTGAKASRRIDQRSG
jgi:integrase/recombinase XerD